MLVNGFWMYPYERFNSWITRRVTNRRYPEATVMETYRLSEWAHFMEVAGKLPDGAASASVLDLSPQDVSHSMCSDLTDEQVDQLESIYGDEKCNFTRAAEFRNNITYMDHHKRVVRLTTAEADREHSHVRCSYISSSTQDGVTVGRIVSLFHHVHRSRTTAFAYVSWFDGPFTDDDSQLTFVDTSVQSQSVTPVVSLSKPLLVAFDEEEAGKLWIINFCSKC